MGAVVQRGSEDVNIAAFFEFEFLSQFSNSGRKVADGEVGLTDT